MKLSLKKIGNILFLTGFGIALHDFVHQVLEIKGTVFSPEGGYVGFILMLIGYTLIYKIWR
ncbi:MAG: hypothetical protein QXK24_00085 [Ignisphaera sp.]